jgi:hypothetical protein
VVHSRRQRGLGRGGGRSSRPGPGFRTHRARGGSTQPVRPAERHQGHRCQLRKGRGGEVDGDGQPGCGAGPGRSRRGRARRRRLRLLRPGHARHRLRAHGAGQQDGAARGVRGPVHVDGLLRRRQSTGHLARPDAAQGTRAVPGRRRLGQPRIPPDRHAAGHGRRGPVHGAVPADVGGLRRDDAATGGPPGGPAQRLHGQEDQPPRARRHREHELVDGRRRQPAGTVRRRRRPRTGRRTGRPAARPGAAVSRAAGRRRRGTTDRGGRSRLGDGPLLCGHLAELAARGRARIFRPELTIR